MKLETDAELGAFVAKLSIGEKFKVCLSPAFAEDSGVPCSYYDAEVIDKYLAPDVEEQAQRTRVQIDMADAVVGGHITDLWHDDGESLKEDDPRPNGYAHGCFFSVAMEQDDPEEETIFEAIPEDAPPATGPGTRVALTVPGQAQWLLDMATVLESESERYKDWTPPQQSLKSAAASLRSAVGHVLAGNCEK